MSEFDAFARFYDLDHADYQEDIDFYLNFARLAGPPVLDAACGTGRVLVPLARAGFAVTGLDVSPAMLAVAADKVRRFDIGNNVSLVRADLRDFQLGERFELAFVALNSFGHFIDEGDQMAVLARLREHLCDEGLLILDLFNPDQADLVAASGQVFHDYSRLDPATGHTIVKFRSSRLDEARQLLDVTFFYDEVQQDGGVKRVVAPFSLRYFYRREMELLLGLTGFKVENVYGSYDLEDYEAESPKMIFVARKA